MNISTSINFAQSYQSLQDNSHNKSEKSIVKPEQNGNLSEQDKTSNITKPNVEETQELSLLQSRDTEVRSHEAAHISAGGSSVTGGASFTYQQGPDGKQYAIGGEVPISIGGGSSLEEKIASTVSARSGALAPANPSPADLKIASTAALMESTFRQELAQENKEEIISKATKAYEQYSKPAGNGSENFSTTEQPNLDLFI